MRIRTVVAALVGASATWHVQAQETGLAEGAKSEAERPTEQVVIAGDKLRRMEIDSGVSVGARNRRQIAESGSNTLEDVASQMANVGTAQNLSIRGVTVYGPTGGGGHTITLLVDGVTQDGYGQDIGNLSVWDADRVEVLRGPQSTSQGRNSLAGAVVLKTRDPSDTADFQYRVSAGNQHAHQVAAAGGGALVEGVLSGRIAIEERKRDGDIDNPTRGDRRFNHDDGHTARAKLRFTPSATDYQALLTLVDGRQRLGSPTVEAVTRPIDARINLSDGPRYSNNHTRSAALEQTLPLHGADLTLLTTYSHNDYTRLQDYDATELKQGYRTGHNVDRQWSQEARVNFKADVGGNRLSGVAGLYYLNARYDANDGFTVPVSYVLGLLGQCQVQSQCDAVYGADFIDRGNVENSATRTRAAFTELDYALGKLTLTAGLRYDSERQSRVLTGATNGTSALAGTIIRNLISGGVFSPDGRQDLGTDNAVWLPKLGLRYTVTRDWVAGLTAQRGYRTGGVDYGYQRGTNAYGPEFTKNYEASLKGVVGAGMLVTLNTYRIDWSDQQVDIGRSSLDTYIVNAGRSRLQGLEAEVRGKAAPRLELFGAFGLARTRFIDFASAQGDFSGKQFARSPRQSASAGFSWTPGPWLVNTNVVYAGGTYTGPENVERNDAHTIVNGKAALALGDKLSLFVFGSNLFNRTYVTSNRLVTVPGRYGVLLGAARRVGVGLQGSL